MKFVIIMYQEYPLKDTPLYNSITDTWDHDDPTDLNELSD